MVEVNLKQAVRATSSQLCALFLDHKNLSRFFNAEFTVDRPAMSGEIHGGKGCRRRVNMRGNHFVEEIISADTTEIQYKIIGDKPLSGHLGRIAFYTLKRTQDNLDKSVNAQQTEISYKIIGKAPFWQPTWLVAWVIKRDIQKGLEKIAEHFHAH